MIYIISIADPLSKHVEAFTNQMSSKFEGETLTQLMKVVALKQELRVTRQVELSSSCMEATCTVRHSEGRTNTGVTPLYWACKATVNYQGLSGLP